MSESNIWNQVKGVTRVQAKVFGRELGLRQEDINGCIDKEETSDLAAHAMFVRKKQGMSNDNEIVNLLNRAIEALDQEQNPKNTLPKTKPITG